jgi:hypothetical protein
MEAHYLKKERVDDYEKSICLQGCFNGKLKGTFYL